MDKDHLPLLEDQNPVRRSEIFAGTGSAKVALTEAIKSLSNVSGREADVVFRHAWSINPLDRCILPGFSYKPGDTASNNHFEMVFNGFA
ncbi:hypothetical protein L2X67_17125 [Enterobacter ludwigii]|nr:hypothetical protein [Enterobacter ludwigii]